MRGGKERVSNPGRYLRRRKDEAKDGLRGRAAIIALAGRVSRFLVNNQIEPEAQPRRGVGVSVGCEVLTQQSKTLPAAPVGSITGQQQHSDVLARD